MMDKCNFTFEINSPEGCPSSMKTMNTVKILIYFCLLFFFYLSAGYYYNKRFQEKEGIEAIPNISFWRELPSLVQDGVIFCINQIKYLNSYVRHKLGNKYSAYNEI